MNILVAGSLISISPFPCPPGYAMRRANAGARCWDCNPSFLYYKDL